MQHVEQLALVLVQALHLHVEDRFPVDRESVLALDVRRELLLVPLLDVAEFGAERFVFGERLQLAQLVQIDGPALADPLGDGGRQQGIGRQKPTARGDAVRLAVEAIRPHLVEVAQQVLLEQLRVQRRDAVDRVGPDHGEVRHPDPLRGGLAVSFVDQRHA